MLKYINNYNSKDKNYIRRSPLTGTLSLFCCLYHLRSASSPSLHSRFRSLFFLDLFSSNALIILVPFFQIFWIIKFTRPNFRHRSPFFFHFLYLVTLTFPSRPRTLLLFVTVAISSLYQFPDNCRKWKVEGNFTRNAGYNYYCYFPCLEFIYIPQTVKDMPFQGRWVGWIIFFSDNYIRTDYWNYYIGGRFSYVCRNKQHRKNTCLIGN